jgi:hypothetical protein
MKKLLFTIISLNLLVLNAQVSERIKSDYPQFKIVVKDEASNNSKREVGGGWFDYANAYNTTNAVGLTSSVYFMQPDTNLNVVGTDGAKVRTPFHVLGRVNDPRDDVFNGMPNRFSKFNTYTWDSLRFFQFYVRNADSMFDGVENVEIIDTVIIQYFLPAGLERPSYYYNDKPTVNYYAAFPLRNNFNWRTKLNSSAFKTDTIFLNKELADSVALNGANTTFFGRRITIPVGTTVTANMNDLKASLVAHTVTFKPMKKPANGDTGIAYNGATWKNKFNMYGIRMFAKTGVLVENINPEAVNNAIICNFQVGYGQTTGIWKSYIPGTVFNSTLFEGASYHLTTQTLSIKNVDNKGNGIGNIFPNPTGGNNEVFIPIKLESAKEVTFVIRDITGKVIKTITENYNSGDFDVVLSLDGFAKGIYSCTMTTDTFTGSSKFSVN